MTRKSFSAGPCKYLHSYDEKLCKIYAKERNGKKEIIYYKLLVMKRTDVKKPFRKIVNAFNSDKNTTSKDELRTQSNISDIVFCENGLRLKITTPMSMEENIEVITDHSHSSEELSNFFSNGIKALIICRDNFYLTEIGTLIDPVDIGISN